MFDYLDKFNILNSDLKASVSDPEALKIIEDLESEYNIELASLIMRVMVKDVSVEMLPLTLFTEFKLGQAKSEKLAKDLEVKIFSRVGDYLGILPLVDPHKNVEAPPNIESVIEKEKKVSSVDESSKKIKKNDSKNIIKESKFKDKNSKVIIEIINSLNIKFKKEEEKLKFLSLLDKYLRGVKDRFLVRQILTADSASGGLNLSNKIVDKIFIITRDIENKEYNKVKQGLKVENDILAKINKLSHGKILDEFETKIIDKKKKPELLSPLVPAVISEVGMPMVIEDTPEKIKGKLTKIKKDFDKIEKFSQEEKKDISSEKEKIKKQIIEKKELAKKDLSLKKDLNNINKNKDKNDFDIPIKDRQENRPMAGKVDIKPDSSGKIKISDVRRVKITGPIDELKYMDLVNFHRLSGDPIDAFEKIRQKLEVLKNIDYTKMLEGIKSWRQSPIYKLYLKIFSKASEEGISINQVIENLKVSGNDYLSREEINALINFNKSLII